jgi:hypothetical protein
MGQGAAVRWVDEDAATVALDALAAHGLRDGESFEVRILSRGERGVTIGTFGPGDVAACVKALVSHGKRNGWMGCYFTPNPVARLVTGALAKAKTGDGAKDADVTRRRWLLVDIDAVRPKGVSATEEERGHARRVASLIVGELCDGLGWPRPVVTDSGNGAHVMWLCDLDAASDLPMRFVKALMRFSTAHAAVDPVVGNAARIWRLPGTWSAKGESTEERPHRMANVLEWGDGVPVSREQIEAFVGPVAAPKTTPAVWASGASGAASTRFQDAAARYVAERSRAYPTSVGTCPVCQHNGCFKALAGASDRWICWSSGHTEGVGVGGWIEGKNSFTGDALDIDAHAGGKTPKEHLVSEGYLKAWEERPARAAKAEAEPPEWVREPIPDEVEVTSEAAPAQPKAAQIERDVILVVDGELGAQVDAVVRALAKHPDIYSRTNSMVMAGRGGDGLTQLRALSKASARVIIEERAVFVEERRGKNGPVPQRRSVSDRVVEAVITMPERWGGVLREVHGVHRLPVLRMNGELVGEGYDPETKLLVDFSGAKFAETRTTREAAVKAVEWLEDLLCDFPWESELDRTTMVALLITATMRRTFRLCPGFLIDSPSSGIGKGTLVNMTSMLMSGHMPANMNQPGSEDELRKTVFSYLRDGVPHLSIDNITLPFGGEAYDTMMTSEIYTQRVLGESSTESAPNRTLITITGRNVKFRGDGVGRTVRARMVTMMERPDVGRTFKYPDLVDYVRENRESLVPACLSIARAYLLAGRPNKCSPLREFVQWNAMVREPLMWLGRGDVIASIEAQRVDSDEDVSAYLELAAAWHDVYGERPVSLAEAVEELVALKHGGGGGSMTESDKAKRRRLTHAIVTACGVQIDAAAITKHLRRAVATNEGRVVAGLKFGPSAKRGLRGLQFQAVATGKRLDTNTGPSTLAPTEAKDETWWS